MWVVTLTKPVNGLTLAYAPRFFPRFFYTEAEATMLKQEVASRGGTATVESVQDIHGVDTRREQLEAALENLIAAIPPESKDKDWWPDELAAAVAHAKALLGY